jgi:DNA-directed RNA polymerase specialized sigma24 family protein
MALQKRKPDASGNDSGGRKRVSAEEKIARLLGLMVVKDIEKKTDQVPLLRRAGFGVSEVADMLGMTENHVKVADHLGRKKTSG